MLQSEYEKLPIIEDVKIYSQTEDGFIYVCSKKDFDVPIYKWKDVYLKFTDSIPKNISELKNSVYYGELNDFDAEILFKFLHSYDKVSTPNTESFVVYEIAKELWQSFHRAIELGLY